MGHGTGDSRNNARKHIGVSALNQLAISDLLGHEEELFLSSVTDDLASTRVVDSEGTGEALRAVANQTGVMIRMQDQTAKHSESTAQRQSDSFVWVKIPSRSAPVLVSPEQAKVLAAIDELRATLKARGSKNKHS